jgi:putative cardiolipin synthase
MGVLLGSRTLAQWLGDQFDNTLPLVAYEVTLGEDGFSLVWIERTAGGQVRHDTEPGTTWFQRTGVEMMSLLPIEWLL